MRKQSGFGSGRIVSLRERSDGLRGEPVFICHAAKVGAGGFGGLHSGFFACFFGSTSASFSEAV